MRTAAKTYSYHRNGKWSLFTRTLFLYPSIVSGGDSSRLNLQRCRSLRACWIASKSSFCASKYVKRWQDKVTFTVNCRSAVLREILKKEAWATYRGWSSSPLSSLKIGTDIDSSRWSPICCKWFLYFGYSPRSSRKPLWSLPDLPSEVLAVYVRRFQKIDSVLSYCSLCSACEVVYR